MVPEISSQFWGQRARLDVDVKSETDWGTLRAQYRLEAGDSNTDANIDMDKALFTIAGFRAGLTDNNWTSNHSYAGVDLVGIGSTFTAVHDSLAPDNSGTNAVTGAGGADFGSWAYKGSGSLNLSDFVPGGLLHFMYMWDGDYNTDYVHNYNVIADLESVFQVAGEAMITKDVKFMAQYSDGSGDDGGTLNGVAGGEGDAWIGTVAMTWYPTSQFSISASYFFGEVDNTAGDGTSVADLTRTSYDFDGFFIGVRRDF